MPVDECVGDNDHQESRNESIGSDHLSDKPVLRTSGVSFKDLDDLGSSMGAKPSYPIEVGIGQQERTSRHQSFD